MYISRPARQLGVSLIELIMFIVIISIALTGVLLMMNQITGQSADTLVRKQALAIAESLLEEVELMPFTYCDPDDASAVTAASVAGCTTSEAIGTEAGETRYITPKFDNVNDYHNFFMNSGTGGIKDISNALVAGLGSYAASVVVAAPAAGLGGIPAVSGVLQITVTVTGPGPDNTPIVLDGYRARYAPNGEL
jgi:MSHA pilin protein MshD